MPSYELVNEKINDEYFYGYKISTSQDGDIKVYISDHQSCCELYGIMITYENILTESVITKVGWGNDNDPVLVDFVISDIKKDNHMTDVKFWKDDIQMAVVEFDTDLGKCHIIAYNLHNVSYPHTIHVEWNGNIDTQVI